MDEITVAESEFEALKEKMRRLRAEISALTARRDELSLRECPRIKAEYDARIGVLELRAIEAGNRVLQLKRAIEILQAARNRGEEKNGEEAESQAGEEYRQYQDDIRRKADDIRNSRKYREKEKEREEAWRKENREDTGKKEGEKEGEKEGNPDGEGSGSGKEPESGTSSGDASGNGESGTSRADPFGDDTARYRQNGRKDGGGKENEQGRTFRSRDEELRYYYRLLVKKLHPDANPNQTEEDARLLRETMEAYKEGDLDKLKEIWKVMKSRRPETDFRDTPEDIAEMKRIIADLEEKKESLRMEIASIQNRYPYKWKAFLANDEAVEARRRELTALIDTYEKQYEELKIRFENLKNGKEPG